MELRVDVLHLMDILEQVVFTAEVLVTLIQSVELAEEEH
jgi:hypothetical protein